MTRIAILLCKSAVLLVAMMGVLGAPLLRAQSSFVLSKKADFSTDDRVFEREDTLYALVIAPQIDFTNLDKNEFRLKPDEGGNDIEGAFINHFDGTYTVVVPLSITDPDEDDWEWRARIEDDDGHEFEARVELDIGEEEGDDDDDGDEDDDDEDEDEVEFTGTIEALTDSTITVDSLTFDVTARTVILDDDNNPIPFSDLAVGMTVQIRADRRADGVLIATRIKIEDASGTPDASGPIGDIEADRLTVGGITFLVDDSTRVLDANEAPLAFSDLEVGQHVEVFARISTMPVAHRVRVLGEGDVAAGTEEAARELPVQFILEQNYPNPFNPVTTISFEIVEASKEPVSLVVYNVLGVAVRVLLQSDLGPGRYEVAWDARNEQGHRVASGLYLYRLRIGHQVQTRSMLLLK